ncbi:T9SS type A sorting domain-containing protein [Winogradskyella luteola]|uniref:T9SS type A sorting domain-containing protein n=1 Tax=Winogradskyella luteola TaxID=2828330 RepID=A0A9X1FAJ8_9FLAO|nr:T9SS type A sorting domain-containing protein [Winogradskyella luteola]MBV7270315.1 T9SS type A sorting domain-containing protein [Winogradskyella luteola]
MKQIKIITIMLYLIVKSASAQIQEVIDNINNPLGIALLNDELFISEYSSNKIIKIDVTIANPSKIDVLSTGLNFPNEILLDGNFLYVANIGSNKIIRFDATSVNPTPVDVVTGISDIRGMAIMGNELFIADYSAGIVYKTDISGSIPSQLTTVLTGLNGPWGLAGNNNELYIVERDGNKIIKIDIALSTPTPIDVITTLSNPLDIEFVNDDLFVTELGNQNISRIDTSTILPITTTQEIVSGLNFPYELEISGNTIYFIEASLNRISKFDGALSVNDEPNIEQIKLYPNPASEKLMLKNINSDIPYSIYNILGQEVKKGIYESGKQINVVDLESGIYYLSLGSGISEPLMFVKK